MKVVIARRYEFFCVVNWEQEACRKALLNLFRTLKWKVEEETGDSIVGSRFGLIGRRLIEIPYMGHLRCDRVIARFEKRLDKQTLMKIKVIVRKRSLLMRPFLPAPIKEQAFVGYIVHALDNKMLFSNVERAWVEVFRTVKERVFGDDWLGNWTENVLVRSFVPGVLTQQMADWIQKLGVY